MSCGIAAFEATFCSIFRAPNKKEGRAGQGGHHDGRKLEASAREVGSGGCVPHTRTRQTNGACCDTPRITRAHNSLASCALPTPLLAVPHLDPHLRSRIRGRSALHCNSFTHAPMNGTREKEREKGVCAPPHSPEHFHSVHTTLGSTGFGSKRKPPDAHK